MVLQLLYTNQVSLLNYNEPNNEVTNSIGAPNSPRLHQPVAGLILHRSIIAGQKPLADTLGNGVKMCAGAVGEDEAFHKGIIVLKVINYLQHDSPLFPKKASAPRHP